jgi:hypothetical protein
MMSASSTSNFKTQHGPAAMSRRHWLRDSAVTMAGLASLGVKPPTAHAAANDKALIAITLDLEMSRNFPTWESTHWDYEKGNLNEQTKQYSVEAARRVKSAGGVMHFFAVGRVFEQADVGWARKLIDEGHLIGNHTYDHVNVTATKVEDLQYRFRRAPWLLRGQSVAEAIRENIRLCELAMQNRLGTRPNGFRTPGGFRDGLRDHPGVRGILRELGYSWVSSLYPPHPYTKPKQQPTADIIDAIVTAQQAAQPFTYPDGLIEIPMSPISDIGAFRTGRWKLDSFLTTIRQCVEWAIENRAVFDFLAHPSCLYVVDPEFKTIEMITDLVASAGDRASIVDLNTIASRSRT